MLTDHAAPDPPIVTVAARPARAEPAASRQVELVGLRVETEWPSTSTIVVSVFGELDLYTVPELAAALAEALAAQARCVVVDLTSATFFDSAALLALVSFRHELAPQSERELAVVSPNPAVTKVFTITGLDRLFAIVQTRAEASALEATP